MTFSLNLQLQNSCEKIYFVYDFNQVADAVLMVRYNNDLHEWHKSFLHYELGQWITDKSTYDADSIMLNKIDRRLKRIRFINPKTRKHVYEVTQKLFPEHALLLLDACS